MKRWKLPLDLFAWTSTLSPDKLYMKDAKTIIMGRFSAEQRDEDRRSGKGAENSRRPRNSQWKDL